MPAEGAQVKILSPAAAANIHRRQSAVKIHLNQGQARRARARVHRRRIDWVCLESQQGTLNGIAPGRHTLELRVVAADHQTELDAKDRIEFIVK